MALSKIQTPLIDTTTDLGDYEEGTWTPVVSCTGNDTYTGAYTYQYGRYIRIGKMVTAWCYLHVTDDLTTNGLTGAQDIHIAGFPLNVSANISGTALNNSTNWINGQTMQYPGVLDYSGTLWDSAADKDHVMPFLREVDNVMRFRTSGEASAAQNISVSEVSDFYMKIQVTYETDAN